MQAIKKPFSEKEKAYILANCEKMTIRELEANLKQQDFCLLYGDLYHKLLGFLKRKNNNFKRRLTCVYYQNGITSREVQVLELMAKGLADEEIADKLFVSTTTIKTHVNNIASKLWLIGSPPHTIRVKIILWYLENIKHIDLKE